MAKAVAKKKEGAWETAKTIFWALVIAMVFRSLLFQPFSIPSGSMKPTLLVGDYLFVSKYAYGYSQYSFPFSPDLFDGRLWGELPERGDVVVFKHPRKDQCSEGPVEFVARLGSNILSTVGLTRPIRDPDDCVDYIKRVIGLPGDTIQMIDGVLNINGVPVGMTRDDDFLEPKGLEGEVMAMAGCLNEPVAQGGDCAIEQWIEELPEGRRHDVLNLRASYVDSTPPIKVQEGHILFMGDNRDNSVDSRFPEVGQVPVENLIGRAEIIALSSSGAFWEVWKWRPERFLQLIH
jgi:signal peptidase I